MEKVRFLRGTREAFERLMNCENDIFYVVEEHNTNNQSETEKEED
jgi:hypothetical protein